MDQNRRGLLRAQTAVRGLEKLGTRSFVVYRKLNGKKFLVTLGRHPDLSLVAARDLAEQMNAAIRRGEDPSHEKREKRQEPNFGEFFRLYIDQHAKPHTVGWRETEAKFRRFLKPFSSRKLADIRKMDIQRLQTKVRAERGPYSANRIVAVLSSIFNKAIEWGFADSNPAVGLRKFRETSRDRFLQPDELPRFFQALQMEPNETMRDFILTCLITGARRGNVLAMRWDQIDFGQAIWRIPAQNAKAGRRIDVHIHSQLLDMLVSRRDFVESVWVFPGPGKSGHLQEPKKAWARLIGRAKIQDLRIHDLRRTLGSWQAAGGASLSVIGKSLGHQNLATTAIYARLNLDPVRKSVDHAVDAMLQAGEVDAEKVSARRTL